MKLAKVFLALFILALFMALTNSAFSQSARTPTMGAFNNR